MLTAYYTQSSAYVIAQGGTETWLDFDTKGLDTANAVVGAGSGPKSASGSTWRFVVPADGVYAVQAMVIFDSNTQPLPAYVAWLSVIVNRGRDALDDFKIAQIDMPAGQYSSIVTLSGSIHLQLKAEIASTNYSSLACV